MIHSAKSNSFVTEKSGVLDIYKDQNNTSSVPFLFVLEESKKRGRVCFLESCFYSL